MHELVYGYLWQNVQNLKTIGGKELGEEKDKIITSVVKNGILIYE